jgi:hypothetical protein
MAGQPAFLRLVSLFPVFHGLMGSLARPKASNVQSDDSKGPVLKSNIVTFEQVFLISRGIKLRNCRNHKG